jgi:hypothetical protein
LGGYFKKGLLFWYDISNEQKSHDVLGAGMVNYNLNRAKKAQL